MPKYRKPKGKRLAKHSIEKVDIDFVDRGEGEYSTTFVNGQTVVLVYTGESLEEARRHANTIKAVNSYLTGKPTTISETCTRPESFDTFAEWFKAKLGDSAQDICNHGCDGGFPYITYTADCVKLYDEFESEIYDALNEDASDQGLKSVDELTATFRRADMLGAPDQRKNLLLWYMVEREARAFVDRGDHRELDNG